MAGRAERRPSSPGRHHLASVADAFLSADRATPGAMVLAGPGVGVTSAVASGLSSGLDRGRLHDLGDTVGVRLARWEREGLDRTLTAPAPSVLIWCVQGCEAASLVSGLVLGRLAALLEPLATTMVWLPEHGCMARVEPEPALRERVRELVTVAAPRARVGVYCVGWRQSVAEDLTNLAARFARVS